MRLGIIALGIVVLSALLAAGCGGGNNSGGGTDDDASKLLTAMPLTVDQLPAGLIQVSTTTTTNNDLAAAAADPQVELARLQSLGRRLGYDVQFVPGQDAKPGLVVQGFENSVSLFKTADGAGQSLADGLAATRQTDWKKAHSELQDVQVDQPALPKEADEGAWFRVSGTGTKNNVVIDNQIAFRVENVRAFLRVVLLFPPGTARGSYDDQVKQWVTLEATKIRDVLHGTPVGTPAATPNL